MAQLDISTISNTTLRQAAEAADFHDGNNGYNTKLDTSEIQVFVRQAYKNGCSEQEIISVAEQLGVKIGEKSEGADIIAEMQELSETKKRLENLKSQLVERQNTLDSMQEDYDETRPETTDRGEGIGMWAGGLSGAVAALKIPVPHPLLKLLCAAGGFIGGAGVGGAIGVGVDKLIAVFKPDSYEGKVQKKKIVDYEQSAIDPLKEQIEKVEQEFKEKEEAFYD